MYKSNSIKFILFEPSLTKHILATFCINLKSNYPYTVEIKPQDIVDKFLSLKVEQ